jgi:hypothetical protein
MTCYTPTFCNIAHFTSNDVERGWLSCLCAVYVFGIFGVILISGYFILYYYIIYLDIMGNTFKIYLAMLCTPSSSTKHLIKYIIVYKSTLKCDDLRCATKSRPCVVTYGAGGPLHCSSPSKAPLFSPSGNDSQASPRTGNDLLR